jgi:hypothetical protein
MYNYFVVCTFDDKVITFDLDADYQLEAACLARKRLMEADVPEEGVFRVYNMTLAENEIVNGFEWMLEQAS